MAESPAHADAAADAQLFIQRAGQKARKIHGRLVFGIRFHKLDKGAVLARDADGAVRFVLYVLRKEGDDVRSFSLRGNGEHKAGKVGNGILDAVFLNVRRGAFPEQDAAHKLALRQIDGARRGIFDEIGQQKGVIFLHAGGAFQPEQILFAAEHCLEIGAAVLLQDPLKIGRDPLPRRRGDGIARCGVHVEIQPRIFVDGTKSFFEFAVHISLPQAQNTVRCISL